MTKSEIATFDAGVLAVLDLAARTAESLRPQLARRPTRIGFAVAALEGLAEEGQALLKGGSDGLQGEMIPPSPKPPNGLSGAPAKARAAYVSTIPAGADGNFGLTDEEIMRPSRETIVNWLSGRMPMLASHWSKIAARMLDEEMPAERAITAAQ